MCFNSRAINVAHLEENLIEILAEISPRSETVIKWDEKYITPDCRHILFSVRHPTKSDINVVNLKEKKITIIPRRSNTNPPIIFYEVNSISKDGRYLLLSTPGEV